MANMASAGFNTIKIWAQWRWNHPKDDRFDFSDLREIMNLAGKHEIKVVINLILDCAPAWLFNKYPDCRMITADGRALGPVTTAYRQIGGVPAHCLHHPGAVADSVRFTKALAEEFCDHPALAFWDLWNEPELTVGLLREPSIADIVCHCPHTKAAFVEWNRTRYGTLNGLNAAWKRNYGTWDELEIPIEPQTYRDFIDWRVFFAESVQEELIRRKDAVRKYDSSHAVMCHTVPPPVFSYMSCGSDDWLLAEPGDFHGNSLGSDPFAADLLRSAARGKPVINAEIHALPGGTFSRPHPIGDAEMKRHILTPLSHGIKGFLFWQYRSERLGAESPAWGLCNPDGTPADWLAPVSRMARQMTAESEFFLKAEPTRAKVAILNDPENQVFCWAGTLSGDIYAKSLDGAYRALYHAGYTVDFVHPRDFDTDAHRQYECIYLPIPYWLSTPVADKLAEYVESGGSVISEMWLGAYDSRDNLHSLIVPGMGLHTVFGVTERKTRPQPNNFSAYDMWRITGQAEPGIFLLMTENTGLLDRGDQVAVAVASSEYQGLAKVLAELPDGQPAVVENSFGKGKAILAGALLGYSASLDMKGAAAKLLTGLVERCVGMPTLEVIGPGRADALSDGARTLLTVSNESIESDTIRVRVSGLPVGFLGNEPTPAVVSEWMEFSLPGRAVEAYWI